MQYLMYFAKKMHTFAGTILYLNLFGMLIIGFLDGMGLLLLLPLLSISGILNTGSFSFWGIFDFLKSVPKPLAVLYILGAYVVLMVGQTLIQRSLQLRDTKLHTGFINHVRLETYRALLQANWDFFVKRRKSDFINSLTDELGRVMNGTYLFLQLLSSIAFTLIQVGIAFWLSFEMTIFVLCCGVVIAFFSRTFIKKSKMLGNQTSELARSYIGEITDQFNGIKDIKSNMLEHSRNTWLQIWCQKVSSEWYEYARIKMNSNLYYKISSTLIIASFIYFSAILFQTRGEQLLLIILIFSRLWPRFTTIQSNLEQIAASIPALKSLMELEQEAMGAREINGRSLDFTDVKPIRVRESIECLDVHFRYNRDQEHFALRNVNLQVRSKQLTAIVGRSGAGKSTLIDILMGLLLPEQGQVLIDGVPLTGDNLLSFRKSIGYVSQDPLLFNGSIRQNLLLVEPNASEEQLWEALQFSAAAEFVKRLPQGLDTLMGDRGVRLSGGERQRIVLARAILRNPSILVLDEATSALDTENETKIQEALARLKGKMTIIVIAHRLSTIRNADQVIVLDQGLIVQKGGFKQLADEQGVFSNLLGNQAWDYQIIAHM